MKRRSFFQWIIGGFAAAIGVKLAPQTVYFPPYRGHAIKFWDVPSAQWMELPPAEERLAGYEWVYDQMVPTITVEEPPNVGFTFIASGGQGYLLPPSPELDAALAARDELKVGPTIYKRV